MNQITPNLKYETYDEYCKSFDSEYDLKYPNVLNKIEHVYAIGDVHGDFNFLIETLFKINVIVINENIIDKYNIDRYKLSDNEIFNNTLIVQVGDQIDGYRKNDTYNINRIPSSNFLIPKDESIIKLMDKLGNEAYNQHRNFHVLSLLGNHELLNIIGDFRYSFNPDSSKEIILKRKKMITKIFHNLICNRNIIILVNDTTIFAHAGIINDSINCINFLMNSTDNKYKININDHNIISKYNNLCKIILYYIIKNNGKYNFNNIIDQLYTNIFALRNYDYTNDEDCNSFELISQILHIDNMIIGHNSQDDGSIKIRKCI